MTRKNNKGKSSLITEDLDNPISEVYPILDVDVARDQLEHAAHKNSEQD